MVYTYTLNYGKRRWIHEIEWILGAGNNTKLLNNCELKEISIILIAVTFLGEGET
jgi:hypothetical protein